MICRVRLVVCAGLPPVFTKLLLLVVMNEGLLFPRSLLLHEPLLAHRHCHRRRHVCFWFRLNDFYTVTYRTCQHTVWNTSLVNETITTKCTPRLEGVLGFPQGMVRLCGWHSVIGWSSSAVLRPVVVRWCCVVLVWSCSFMCALNVTIRQEILLCVVKLSHLSPSWLISSHCRRLFASLM